MCSEQNNGAHCILDAKPHPVHQALLRGEVVVWRNADYVEPPKPKSKAEKTDKIQELVNAVEANKPADLRAEIQQGMATAEDNADPEWKAAALIAIRYCAEAFEMFTRTQVWDRLAETSQATTHNPAALGPILLKAARNGWIQNSGQVEMVQETGHRKNYVVIWRSNLSRTATPEPVGAGLRHFD